ncbi:hypothetical protein RB213_006041 [Colletotrichum asianum]
MQRLGIIITRYTAGAIASGLMWFIFTQTSYFCLARFNDSRRSWPQDNTKHQQCWNVSRTAKRIALKSQTVQQRLARVVITVNVVPAAKQASSSKGDGTKKNKFKTLRSLKQDASESDFGKRLKAWSNQSTD